MADPVRDAIEQAAVDGVQSATSDGRTTVARPVGELIAADKHLAAKDALAGSNPQGGRRSGWAGLRPARVIPPGGV